MEEIREVALAFYKQSPKEVQSFAKKFFRGLDTNRDGKISLNEFTKYVTSNCKRFMKQPTLFQELDRDGDGYLNFEEVIVFYYIVISRGYCAICDRTLTSTYFTCYDCYCGFNNSAYNLCFTCYNNQAFKHTGHNKQHQFFLDNYAMMWFLQQENSETANNAENQSSSSVDNKNKVETSFGERWKQKLHIGGSSSVDNKNELVVYQGSSSVDNKNELVVYQKPPLTEKMKQGLAIGANISQIGATAAVLLHHLLQMQCNIM